MKKFVVLFLSLNLCACTSFYPVSTASQDIQSEVRAGTAVKIGDRVRITMNDASEHELVVRRLTLDKVIGEDAEVSINDIASIEIRKISKGKTTGLIVGIVVASVVLARRLAKEVVDTLFGSLR